MDRKEAIRILMHLDKYVEHDEYFGIMVRSPLMDATLLAIKALKADAVEVVRCKDCVYWEPFSAASECGSCNGCRNGLTEEYITGEDFCSYGKRRTDA